jgi:hypothetical protein
VYAKDLAAADGPMPTSPAQALAQQKANQGKSTSINVYKSDGKTVIGVFVIVSGQGSLATPGARPTNP